MLSVGIITANRQAFLRQAIDSVILQGDAVSEIIVVVDGSSDGTVEYLNSLNEPRLKKVIFEENRGRPAARNAVVENLGTDNLLWLDDDDALVEGAVASQLECLNSNPTVDIVYLDYLRCDENLKPQEPSPARNFENNQILMQMVFENVIPNGGTLIRKRVFDKIGGYDSRFPRGQDYHFYVRAALADCVFLRNAKPLYLVRFHQNNLANPIEVRNQSKHQCLILLDMLAEAPIEKIFPVLDWEKEPKVSASRALMIIGRVFFDHGDDESALDCLQHAEDFNSDAETKLMLGFILRAMKRFEQSSEEFAAAGVLLAPSLEGMKVEIGAPRGSARVAEEAELKCKQATS